MELGASKVVPFNFSACAQGGIGKYLEQLARLHEISKSLQMSALLIFC